MTTLTFTDFIEPKQTAAGKWPPSKAKASDGKTYALPKDAVELVKNSLGTPLEVVTQSVKNGQWWNHSVLSAKHVTTPGGTGGATVPERTVPAPPPPQKISASRDEVQRYIVRQSSAARAVEVLGPGKTPADYEEWTNFFTNLVFEEGGDSLEPSIGATTAHTATPATPAQAALEAARSKAADRRNSYSLEDAVCPNCGFKEHLIQGKSGWFCEKKAGGCGHPPKGERLDMPITYGEWKQRTSSVSVPWK